MIVRGYTPTGKPAKPIFNEKGFTARSGTLKPIIFEDEKIPENHNSRRIDCTLSNDKWRVTITREEYEVLKVWFE